MDLRTYDTITVSQGHPTPEPMELCNATPAEFPVIFSITQRRVNHPSSTGIPRIAPIPRVPLDQQRPGPGSIRDKEIHGDVLAIPTIFHELSNPWRGLARVKEQILCGNDHELGEYDGVPVRVDRVDPGAGLEFEPVGAGEETDDPPSTVLCPYAEGEAEGFSIDLHVVVTDEH